MRVKQSFSDIDEHAAQMSGFDQRYVQLSPGPFHGMFSSVVLPSGIGLDVEWLAQAVHQQACAPRQTVSLVTFIDVAGRAIFNGYGVGSHDTFVLAPGTELNVRTPVGAKIAVITIPLETLNREMPQAAEAIRARGVTQATRLLDATTCATTLRPTLMPLLKALDAGSELPPNHSMREAMAAGLLDSTLSLLCNIEGDAGDAVALGSVRRRQVFLSALDIIDRLDADDLAVWKLCRIAGVSRRTLEYCFDEAVAMSPLQYLKVKRLNAVRRELGGAENADMKIGDVAARHGIWHLSRLSKDYAELFGELPSATLRRSRSASSALPPAVPRRQRQR